MSEFWSDDTARLRCLKLALRYLAPPSAVDAVREAEILRRYCSGESAAEAKPTAGRREPVAAEPGSAGRRAGSVESWHDVERLWVEPRRDGSALMLIMSRPCPDEFWTWIGQSLLIRFTQVTVMDGRQVYAASQWRLAGNQDFALPSPLLRLVGPFRKDSAGCGSS